MDKDVLKGIALCVIAMTTQAVVVVLFVEYLSEPLLIFAAPICIIIISIAYRLLFDDGK